MVRGARAHATLEETNTGGQQLFIADLFSGHGAPTPQPVRPATPAPPPPANHRQLVLFHMPRTLRHRGIHGLAQAADPGLAALAEQYIKQRSAQHGWSRDMTWKVRTGVNIMLGFQDTPGVTISATDVAVLAEVALPIRHVLDVLNDAGMLEDDRVPAITAWFHRQVDHLPEALADELGTWFRVMHQGSSTAPRRKPRTSITIQLHLGWALPALNAWAAAGKTSLREISAEDVRKVLPSEGTPRAQMGQGLRSIFRLLKACRIVFTNPISQIKTGFPEPGTPTPLDVTDIREALDSPDPARALVTALIAFHGLCSLQVQHLRLADIHDGRLELGDRSIPLATPVKQRLTAYLDHRTQHWPRTANPHLFVHFRTANSTGHVGYRWIYLKLGDKLNTRSLRTDRFLHEAIATGGDARRLTDLFGLSTQAAQRYTNAVDSPAIDNFQSHNGHHPPPSPRTQAP